MINEWSTQCSETHMVSSLGTEATFKERMNYSKREQLVQSGSKSLFGIVVHTPPARPDPSWGYCPPSTWRARLKAALRRGASEDQPSGRIRSNRHALRTASELPPHEQVHFFSVPQHDNACTFMKSQPQER